jgi:SAM-dependent methyltransferase
MSAHEAYDRLAPHYRAYAEARAAYLGAVDRFVIEHSPRGGRMLDVGSGDGVRAASIGRALGATHVVLCEPSAAMASLCRDQAVAAVWTDRAECLRQSEERFDVVTCLWNVLGHLPDRDARIAALEGMRRLLAPEGRLFCDVNNRHNARAYGPGTVMLRRLLDKVAPDERRGDASFEWNVGGERIPARGHLFTPTEMDGLIRAGQLEVEERMTIDYVSGQMSPSARAGQLVYRLRARRSTTQGALQ